MDHKEVRISNKGFEDFVEDLFLRLFKPQIKRRIHDKTIEMRLKKETDHLLGTKKIWTMLFVLNDNCSTNVLTASLLKTYMIGCEDKNDLTGAQEPSLPIQDLPDEKELHTLGSSSDFTEFWSQILCRRASEVIGEALLEAVQEPASMKEIFPAILKVRLKFVLKN
jgi:hypothetical protein